MNRPRSLSEIPTPALVIDLPALERNIERMARVFADGPCRLRPHFKAHKTPEIARRQLAAGSCVGLTCATVSEAEIAAELCDDLLIANEVVGPGKCERVAALAASRQVTARPRRDHRPRLDPGPVTPGGTHAPLAQEHKVRRVSVTVAVDSTAGLEQIAAAAVRAGATVGVLVDLDVGQGRCGVTPGPEALALAQRVAAAQGVRLRGVMGYEGHLQPVRDRREREARARDAMGRLVSTADLLRQHGLPCEIVSGGGTGTHDISGRVPGVTEIQAGSYALMDSDYGALDLPFEQAFFLLGTIVSRPAADRCMADCGHKAATKDHGHPLVHGIAGAAVLALNDEHAVIGLPPDAAIAVGDRVRLRPSHTDPTINLHDVFYVLDGDRIVDVWPIAARGYGEQRAMM
ncbi:MAG: DSD1 family PLP-dependent enzyme [Acidobacteria bacterium]|nr:DSD1 family PLP-dependent enzyme [Acidobacteriota bacterium]